MEAGGNGDGPPDHFQFFSRARDEHSKEASQAARAVVIWRFSEAEFAEFPRQQRQRDGEKEAEVRRGLFPKRGMRLNQIYLFHLGNVNQ